MDQCSRCGKQYVYSKELRKKGYSKTICNTCRVTVARTKSKQKAVDYKGGKCEVCGYDKCLSALSFHHRDPATKEFTIGAKGSSIAWPRLQKELDKCALLCHNCHSEVHAGLTTLE